MPTVLRSGPYRVFFYSADRPEPPHVHVQRDRAKAKFWLSPIQLERASGFTAVELLALQRLIADNQELLLRSWHDYFAD